MPVKLIHLHHPRRSLLLVMRPGRTVMNLLRYYIRRLRATTTICRVCHIAFIVHVSRARHARVMTRKCTRVRKEWHLFYVRASIFYLFFFSLRRDKRRGLSKSRNERRARRHRLPSAGKAAEIREFHWCRHVQKKGKTERHTSRSLFLSLSVTLWTIYCRYICVCNESLVMRRFCRNSLRERKNVSYFLRFLVSFDANATSKDAGEASDAFLDVWRKYCKLVYMSRHKS